MKKWIAIAFTVIVTSFYFFPFEFRFLPGINTKMAMAGIGLIVVAINLAKHRDAIVQKDFFMLTISALVVSLAGIISISLNNTSDYNYATYIISMWVWAASAYIVILLIKLTHHYRINIQIVCNYLIGVCLLQCFLALLIDTFPAFENLVNTYFGGLGFIDTESLKKTGRLYGIGASLDVAGTRFSAVLIMISSILCTNKKISKQELIFYSASFIFITLIGNMISRTTTVGVIIAIVYFILKSDIIKFKASSNIRKFIIALACLLIIFVPFIIHKYNTDTEFRERIEFAFEGFFTLAQTGEWDVSSNEILKDMYVFPDNMKTWIIGDGYFDSPYYTDPTYVGETYIGYYKNTDVGYLRFIYYFGCIGLFAFIAFFIQTAKVCADRFPKWKTLFWVLLMLNFIIWFKVSTDIFLVFALFLSFSEEDDDSETECTNDDEIATAQ